MFTENYIKFKTARFYGSTATIKTVHGTNFELMTTREDAYDIGKFIGMGRCRSFALADSYSGTGTKFWNTAYTHYSSLSKLYPGVYFGTGTTPATKDDYTLESLITTGLGITNGTVTTVQENEGQYSVSAPFILTNNTEAEMNIFEIGLVGQAVRFTSNDYTQYGAPVLYERTVLTEPITIAPGENKLVTYKLTFNQS